MVNREITSGGEAGSVAGRRTRQATPIRQASDGKPALSDTTLSEKEIAGKFMAGEDRYRMIAEAAYFRAEQRGFVPGNEVEDWLAAELEIDTLLEQDLDRGGRA